VLQCFGNHSLILATKCKQNLFVPTNNILKCMSFCCRDNWVLRNFASKSSVQLVVFFFLYSKDFSKAPQNVEANSRTLNLFPLKCFMNRSKMFASKVPVKCCSHSIHKFKIYPFLLKIIIVFVHMIYLFIYSS
jgi:hypothetical protein